MKRTVYFSILLLTFGLSANGQTTDAYTTLKEGFRNPSVQARPKVYWWWLNGNTDTVRLKEELVAIKKAGIGGVDIFEIGVPVYSNPNGMVKAGPPFMGDESLKAIGLAIREATRLGLEVGLNLASSWNAGGTWITPQHAAKSLYFSKTRVSRPAGPVRLPFPDIARTDEKGKPRMIDFGPDGKPVVRQEVAVVAVPANRKESLPDTAAVIDVSRYFNAEKDLLDWKAPEGDWDVYRFVGAGSGEQLKLPSPNSQAPIIDHFDSLATQVHFQYFIDRLKPVLGDFSKTTLRTLYLASYEATGSVWTPSLPAEFSRLNGYAVHKFLPALFDEALFDPKSTAAFRRDFARTLSELMIRNHYRKAREIANRYGLKIASEAGGPGPPLHNVPVETLKALGALDVPRGEFWHNYHYYDTDSTDIMWLVKEIAAAAHLYGRKIVEEESFTSFHHWQEGPFDLKPIADRAFCEGMNRVVVHGFSHNPRGTGFPGIVYHAGTHFNDKRVWWPKIKPFNDYLARISSVLQESAFVADVLYYYGDKAPNFVPPKNTRFRVGPGYDYEILNTEVLLNGLGVKNRKWTLPNGAEFSVLVLGEEEEMNPAVVARLRKLAADGGAVVTENPRRNIDLGPTTSAGRTARQVLETRRIPPDFSYHDPRDSLIDYIHFRRQTTDVYLVRNTTNRWISRLCSFRQSNKIPELWNPVTGTVAAVTVYEQAGELLRLPISLAPYASYLVVFKPGSSAAHFTRLTTDSSEHPPFIDFTGDGLRFRESGTFRLSRSAGTVTVNSRPRSTPIEGSWELTFPKGWGAPATATFPKLTSWTESGDAGIRYFSGIATYRKTFTFQRDRSMEKGDRLVLDLGKLAKIAEVWLNDRPLGICWAEPYRLDVTDVLKNGANTLRIEVANTWTNRLTGDAITGEKYTNTNIATGFKGVPWKQVPLIESGLLGPVSIQRIKTYR